jgi:fatty acid desaturase
MGKGGLIHPLDEGLTEYCWEEIAQHTERTDKWIVVDGYVYDVTNWAKRHPGGEKIISGYAGQNATEAWYAFHIDKTLVSKYMNAIRIGRVKDSADCLLAIKEKPAIIDDFRTLRTTAENAGYFRPSPTFYILIMAHVLLFDALGWWTMYAFGTGWLPLIVSICLLATAQIQAGWAQHDYGHMSVFNNSRYNHWAQIFLLNFIKGASSDWWNFRHYNHHSKPNILRKDPDISLAPLLLVGDTVATEYGQKKKKYLPYLNQHKYFFFVLPPLLLPLYFNFEIPYFLIKRKRWLELFWTTTFFIRWQFMFSSMVGFWGVFALFLAVRFVESHWFVWTTQMSHIPMAVSYDNQDDWVTMQLKASCNVEQSWFNDWFAGHLNFQIEHHLFPTMPRHNLVKVAPLVRSFCKKYNLDYKCKPMLTAFADIVGCLKTSGEAWMEAYNM